VLRELASRCDVSEGYLAWGQQGLDEGVSEQIRALVEAEASGSKAERRAAYAALGRAANRAARTLRV
jgi:hypothetical protein